MNDFKLGISDGALSMHSQTASPATATTPPSGPVDSGRLTISVPNQEPAVRPRLVVLGVGGAGGNAVNNMIQANLEGVEFVVANTDAQSLRENLSPTKIQLGGGLTEGLGAGSDPETGRAAAEESMDQLLATLDGAHMVFITAGMGGGTGTGAAPEIAKELKANGILTVGVVTRPFDFEGLNRRQVADQGIERLEDSVDTMIVIPNQHLFRIASEKALFSDAMKMADEVLYNGVRAISDLITGTGTWNLDFADVRTLMTGMGKAMMGTGEAEGEGRAVRAAEIAITNPLLEDMDLATASGMLINISAGDDLTFYEVEAAASRIRTEIPVNASIIVGQCTDKELQGRLRVSVVATGLERNSAFVERDRSTVARLHEQAATPAPEATASTTAPLANETDFAAPADAMSEAKSDVEGEGEAKIETTAPPTTHGEPTLRFGQSIQHAMSQERSVPVEAAPASTLSPTNVPGLHESPQALAQNSDAETVAAPPMPRHRDTQALNEMSRESAAPIHRATAAAQVHIPQPAAAPADAAAAPADAAATTAPAPQTQVQAQAQAQAQAQSTVTAYEQALAEAKREAEQAQRAALEAYEREQAALQAKAQMEADSYAARHQQQEQERHQQNAQLEAAYAADSSAWSSSDQTGQATGEGDGLFGRMRSMVSKAARPQNRLNASSSGNHGNSARAGTPMAGGGQPLPPRGPGGGHAANMQAVEAETHQQQDNNQLMAEHQQSQIIGTIDDLGASDRRHHATETRIRTVINQEIRDEREEDDDLLMDIPAFLRRQYN